MLMNKSKRSITPTIGSLGKSLPPQDCSMKKKDKMKSPTYLTPTKCQGLTDIENLESKKM